MFIACLQCVIYGCFVANCEGAETCKEVMQKRSAEHFTDKFSLCLARNSTEDSHTETDQQMLPAERATDYK